MAAMLFVALCLLLGGGPGGSGLALALIGATGFVLLMLGVGAGWLDTFRSLPLLHRLAVAIACALPFAQLVPVPPSVWRSLPGQELRAAILTGFGLGDRWMPLSFTPADTASSGVVALCMLGLFLAALSMPAERVRLLLWTAAAAIALGAIVGVLQFSSGGGVLQFHRNAHRDALIGFFANKNHMGLALACLAPLAHVLWPPRGKPTRGEIALTAIAGVTLVSALVATNSRAGLGLGLLAILLTTLRRFPRQRTRVVIMGAGAAALLVAGAALIPAIGDLAERFGQSRDDVRVDFLEQSLPLASRFGLVGAGLGSFAMVFAAAERLVWVKPTYLNAAHNDYVQVVIEAGAPGLVTVLLLAAAVGWSVLRLRRSESGTDREGDFAWFGLVVILLFAIHSFVDYPVRRVGTLALLVIALALLFRRSAVPGSGGRDVR